ncbi:MAG: lysine--tRNA ligase [Candidatus Freyarchaeum deiterrae]
MEKYWHWIDETVENIVEYWKDRELYVCSCGMSVSGLQHLGRLRGEIVLTNTVKEELLRMGKETEHFLVLYTQDQWKGKGAQLGQFSDKEEAEKYRSRRLIDVPDPFGCHNNWVEHYWSPFRDCLNSFSIGVKTVSTTDLYKTEGMKELVRKTIQRKEELRQVINKYRGRTPYPKDWIPFETFCNECLTIGQHKILSVNLDDYKVEYVCNHCGAQGVSSMEDGKLNWRVEWSALWALFNVSFEPYGKDHATPGGSRDSCVEIVEKIFERKPPFGYPYEWVGFSVDGKDMGDMGSSDFLGITPADWLEVSEPEVLRYLYLKNKPMKRVVIDVSRVPEHSEIYDQAERVYYGVEKVTQEKEEFEMRRSYELSQLRLPPKVLPFQLRYAHAVTLIQTLSKEKLLEDAITKLKTTGLLSGEPSEEDKIRIEKRLNEAKAWLEKYAPERLKLKVLEELPLTLKQQLKEEEKDALRVLVERLGDRELTENELENILYRVAKEEADLGSKKFFQLIYLVLFGQKQGPRLGSFILLMDRSLLLKRLREAYQ